MPIDASTFLASLAESRRAAQTAARSGFLPAPDLVLPDALEVALRHRFLLTPTLARSRLATTSGHLYVPSSEREQLEYWYSQFGDDVNWLLHLGPSNLVAVEIDPAVAQCSLALLSDGDDSLRCGLNFVAHGRRNYLFESATGLLQVHRYPGIRLHAGGNSILVPPSRTASDVELAYEDPQAPLLPFPSLSESSILR